MAYMRKAKVKSKSWKQEVKPGDAFVGDPKDSDIVIAVLGRSGTGKSTFINVLLDKEIALTGAGLRSVTSLVRHYEFPHPKYLERRILVVDTPGFDDFDVPEEEMLRRIAVWLARSYEAGMKLAGLVYLFDINAARFDKSEAKSYGVFEELCGKNEAQKIVLTTSKWDKLGDVEEGEIREKDLTERYWRDMIEHGSTMQRLRRSQGSAQDIIDSILWLESTQYMTLFKELIDENKKISETAAFRKLQQGEREAEGQSAWGKVSTRLQWSRGSQSIIDSILSHDSQRKLADHSKKISPLYDLLLVKCTKAELNNRDRMAFRDAVTATQDMPDKAQRIRDLVAALENIFSDQGKYKQLLSCRESNAQKLLDIFQRLLDLDSTRSKFRSDLIVAAQRLAAKSGLYPMGFDLKNIKAVGENAESSGAFADIYKGVFHNRSVCLKTVRLDQKMAIQGFLKACSKEAILWGQLSHPNLLPFYGIYRFRNRLSLVSPWMENGDITRYLQNNSSANRILLASDAAQGLCFLHDHRIIHGDLKGPNILVNELGRACLADFGLSSVADAEIPAWATQSAAASTGGSVRWQAPELFDPDADDDVHNTVFSDIYAWACVAYEIFAGQIPFYQLTRDTAIMLRVTKGERPSRPEDSSLSWTAWGLTEEIWALMSAGWTADPLSRPTVKQIIEGLGVEMRKQSSGFDDNTADTDRNGSILSPARFREMARAGTSMDDMSVQTLQTLISAT